MNFLFKNTASGNNSSGKELEEIGVSHDAIKYGINSLIIFAIIFASWAFFVPIESAVIAEGLVVLDFNKKIIQHLEGGIVEEILVKEGQEVKIGDPLIILHDIKARSEHQIVAQRLWLMFLQRESLDAEKDFKEQIDMDNFWKKVGEVKNDKDKETLDEIIDNQLSAFKARTARIYGEEKVLEKKLESAIAQEQSARKKLEIFKKELNIIKPLVAEGNLPLLRQYDLEKQIAELEGSTASLLAEVEVARKQITNFKHETIAKIIDETKQTDLEIINLANQLKAAKDVMSRTEILSPVNGKVMNIKYHTIGAVVQPASEIMDIVPDNDQLIIEAKIKPIDIESIHQGLIAKVALTAYSGKKVPKLNGEVVNVSPDIVINEQSKESYFLVRVKVDKQEIDSLKNKVQLYPGMPAQVFIITGSRSLVSYLFTPIKDASYKAFREE